MALAVAAVSALSVGAVTHPAQADEANAVVFGDSVIADPTVLAEIAAKTGTHELAGTKVTEMGCGTDGVYAATFGEAVGLPVRDFSCAGFAFFANANHIQDQVNQAVAKGALSASTREVSILAGANDIIPTIGTVSPEALGTQVADAYTSVLQSIHNAAPNATVRVVGYPSITDGDNVCPFTLVPNAVGMAIPMPTIRRYEEAIQNAARVAADRTGSRFIDSRAATVDQNLCTPNRAFAGVIDTKIGSEANLPIHLTRQAVVDLAQNAAR